GYTWNTYDPYEDTHPKLNFDKMKIYQYSKGTFAIILNRSGWEGIFKYDKNKKQFVESVNSRLFGNNIEDFSNKNCMSNVNIVFNETSSGRIYGGSINGLDTFPYFFEYDVDTDSITKIPLYEWDTENQYEASLFEDTKTIYNFRKSYVANEFRYELGENGLYGKNHMFYFWKDPIKAYNSNNSKGEVALISKPIVEKIEYNGAEYNKYKLNALKFDDDYGRVYLDTLVDGKFPETSPHNRVGNNDGVIVEDYIIREPTSDVAPVSGKTYYKLDDYDMTFSPIYNITGFNITNNANIRLNKIFKRVETSTTEYVKTNINKLEKPLYGVQYYKYELNGSYTA
ncbi:MAG: hypothetical protein K2N99_03000, partial [Malacoplasma sp.]|nr:hypothetical protein [Malacoplasma sp.]